MDALSLVSRNRIEQKKCRVVNRGLVPSAIDLFRRRARTFPAPTCYHSTGIDLGTHGSKYPLIQSLLLQYKTIFTYFFTQMAYKQTDISSYSLAKSLDRTGAHSSIDVSITVTPARHTLSRSHYTEQR